MVLRASPCPRDFMKSGKERVEKAMTMVIALAVLDEMLKALAIPEKSPVASGLSLPSDSFELVEES